MNSLGIVPDKPINQRAVEFIGIKQLVSVVINEFFLDGFVESFKAAVHLRSFRIGMVVDKMESFQFFGEMFFEFRTIVG